MKTRLELFKFFGFLLVLGWALSLSPALAQTTPAAPTELVQTVPQETPAARKAADGVLEGWVLGEFNVNPVTVRTSEQLEEMIIQMLRYTPVSPGAKTNLELARLVSRDTSTRRETYRYPVASSGQDFGVDVTVAPSAAGGWEAYAVRLASSGPTLPPELMSPLAPILFGLATLLLIYGVTRPTLWRTWVQRGLGIAKEQRRVFLWVNVGLYGIFVLGALLAYSTPTLAKEVSDWVGSSLAGTGIVQYLERGVPEAASAITYWNFTQGAFGTTFIPGLLFGIPALFINLGRFLVLGFALSPALIPGLVYLLHLPTVIVELQAYIFITASGLALLWRGRKLGWRLAFREYIYCLPVALTLLVFAAWYEALEILVLIPALAR